MNVAFDKFIDERRYTDFDEVSVKGFSHVSVMTLKRTVKDTDVVITKDEDTTCYEIVFTSLDDVKFFN